MSLRVLGAIIAGGEASRFGSDKALALLEGAPLIDHAIRAIDCFTDAIIVCGRDWPGYETVTDLPTRGLGPLGGINGALAFAGSRGFDAILTIACDMPVVPRALLERIVAAAPAFAADAPILGCWPVTLAPALDAWLVGDNSRSIRRWGLALGATAVPWDAPIPNINTVADLAAR